MKKYYILLVCFSLSFLAGCSGDNSDREKCALLSSNHNKSRHSELYCESVKLCKKVLVGCGPTDAPIYECQYNPSSTGHMICG